MKKKTRILFACTNNSCRSQMAEGIGRALGGDTVEVFSAGTVPTSVNQLAIKVMKEVGTDISGQRSKSIEEINLQEIDYVVTLCGDARDTCAMIPVGSFKRLHWDIIDPASAKGGEEAVLHIFRSVRDELRKRIESLIKETGGSQLPLF